MGRNRIKELKEYKCSPKAQKWLNVLQYLKPNDFVMVWRRFHDRKDLLSIAKEYKITRERVRQKEARCIKKIDNVLNGVIKTKKTHKESKVIKL